MNYLYPFNNVSAAFTTPAPVRSPANVLNGKERDNTWLQLPVCPNLTRKPEERIECDPNAKCRANYGSILKYFCYITYHLFLNFFYLPNLFNDMDFIFYFFIPMFLL
jgi:hypothetical protein